jgi:hypothetical protein
MKMFFERVVMGLVAPPKVMKITLGSATTVHGSATPLVIPSEVEGPAVLTEPFVEMLFD